MARIFISYKKKTIDLVLPLKEKIERETGVKCWLDTTDIKLDEEYRKDITVGINDCEVFLFIYSRHLFEAKDWKKEWPLKEYNYAAEKKKRIVFINIDKSPLSDSILLEFGPQHQIDGTNPKEIDRLIKDLREWLNVGNKQTIIKQAIQVKPESLTIVTETNQTEFKRHNSVSSAFLTDILEGICNILFYNRFTTHLFFAVIGSIGLFLCSKSGGGYDIWNITGYSTLAFWAITGFCALLDADNDFLTTIIHVFIQIISLSALAGFMIGTLK